MTKRERERRRKELDFIKSLQQFNEIATTRGIEVRLTPSKTVYLRYDEMVENEEEKK